jgi:membrane-associated phospholipid phosphatase
MTSVATCKAIQRGEAPTESVTFEAERRYVYNGRTLAECVHTDFSYQFFLNAALILLSYGSNALDPSNPYVTSTNQAGFVTFGGPSILEAVAKAATLALKAAWYQKWCVHRRVRPEMFGLRTHQRVTGTGSATNAYPIHGELLNSDALPALFSKNGTYLLPMSYREGCPAHPAYPGGHATIAAACVTVLKAFFNESFVIPNPVEASETGLSLVPYTGGALTVGNELNKLASNAGLGRDTAGVHWRSDEVEAFKLGEAVGISLLADLSFCTTEPHTGFRLTKFDGTVLEIG